MKLLLATQDKLFKTKVLRLLSPHFSISIVATGVDCLYSLQSDFYNLCVLDDSLADIKGIEIVRLGRAGLIETPICVCLDAYHSEYASSVLDTCANECIQKSIYDVEFVARVKNCVKRYLPSKSKLFYGPIELNLVDMSVTVMGHAVLVRKKEYELLKALVLNKQKVVTRATLLSMLWQNTASNTLDVHIRSLRNKIEKPFNLSLIKTVPGFGYKLEI